jgi:hypothetical protein
MALRWKLERGRTGEWWLARTARGTFTLDPLAGKYVLDYTSATQPAGTVTLGTFGTMASAKQYAEEFAQSYAKHPTTGVAHLIHSRRLGNRRRAARNTRTGRFTRAR